MTRIPEVLKREDLPPDQRPLFDEVVASRGGRIPGPLRILLHSPELARRVAHAGSYVRFESTLPKDVSELAILVTTRELDCDYAWSAHQSLARKAGVRTEAIASIRDRKAPKGLTQDEAVVVRYVKELLRNHRVSDATFEEALEKFGVQKLTDLTATVGYYSMMACVLNAFEVEPESPPSPG